MGLLRRPTPGEIVEGGRLGRPCGPGAHSRAFQKTSLRLRRSSLIPTNLIRCRMANCRAWPAPGHPGHLHCLACWGIGDILGLVTTTQGRGILAYGPFLASRSPATRDRPPCSSRLHSPIGRWRCRHAGRISRSTRTDPAPVLVEARNPTPSSWRRATIAAAPASRGQDGGPASRSSPAAVHSSRATRRASRPSPVLPSTTRPARSPPAVQTSANVSRSWVTAGGRAGPGRARPVEWSRFPGCRGGARAGARVRPVPL